MLFKITTTYAVSMREIFIKYLNYLMLLIKYNFPTQQNLPKICVNALFVTAGGSTTAESCVEAGTKPMPASHSGSACPMK